MAAGDLSADQRSYRDRIAAGTGLDRTLVTAWIGAESGWNTTKPDHNYLNIGPGRSYPSVAAAADAVVQLLRTSHHYAGIRAAIPRGGLAQAQAIAASPWDAGRYGGDGSRLVGLYQQLTGGTSSTPGATPVLELKDLPLIGGLVDELNPGTWVPRLVDNASERFLAVGLTGAFVLAGLTLVGLGLWGLARAGARTTRTLTGG